LASCSSTLRSLELDLSKCDPADYDDISDDSDDSGTPPNVFTEKLLGLAPGKEAVKFTALQHLSLNSADLVVVGSWDEMIEALNLRGLQSLKLHHCDSTVRFLKSIASSSTPLRLRSLEIVDIEDFPDGIASFVNSLQGLEHVSIFFEDPAQTLTQDSGTH
jgi:hypothetical protein